MTNSKVRFGFILAITLLSQGATYADENGFVMNFDLNTLSPGGDVVYSIQLQGIRLKPGTPFHGDGLGKYDYFLTVSELADGKGNLTIEFYEYGSRRKTSDVISEIIAKVDFIFGSPARFEGMSKTFGVDLAFSIDAKR